MPRTDAGSFSSPDPIPSTGDSKPQLNRYRNLILRLNKSFTNIRAVILHPRRDMKRIIDNPDYWGPVIVLALLAILTMLNFALAFRLLNFEVDSSLENKLEQNDMMSSNEIIRVWRINGILLTSLEPVFALLVVILLFWLLLRHGSDLPSSQRSFKICFSILGYISIALLPQELSKTIQLILKGQQTVELNNPGSMKADEYITRQIALHTSDMASGPIVVIGTIISSLWFLSLLFFALQTLGIEKKQAFLLCALFWIFKFIFNYVF